MTHVMSQIALLCKRGPNMGLYEIKAEYRDGSKAEE